VTRLIETGEEAHGGGKSKPSARASR
jgi:hypothetical protein